MPETKFHSTESPNSTSWSAIDQNGFEIIHTHREEDDDVAIANIRAISNKLIESGCKPQPPKTYGRSAAARPAKPPAETVPGRTCPMCQSPLIYFEAKGKKHIKCSTAKWNPVTKTPSGCTFVEWARDERTVDDFPDVN